MRDITSNVKEFILYDTSVIKALNEGSSYPSFCIYMPAWNLNEYGINTEIAFLPDELDNVIADRLFRLTGISYMKSLELYECILESEISLTDEEKRRIINQFRKAKGLKYLWIQDSEINKLLYGAVGKFFKDKSELETYIEDELELDRMEVKPLPDHEWGFRVTYKNSEDSDFEFIYYYLIDAENNLYIHECRGYRP